jgi:peptide/nickel transport system substrate-binding protein
VLTRLLPRLARTGVAVAALLLIVVGGARIIRGGTRTARARPLTLVGSVRAEPRSFNRHVTRDLTSDVVGRLTQASLVRVNRVTDALEPELATDWELLPDSVSYRLQLRREARFSDGAPFTADDVVFSFQVLYEPRVESVLADAVPFGSRQLTATANDAHTVTVRFPSPFGPGLRVLDGIPMLPRHILGGALARGTFQSAWGVTTPVDQIVGLGAFVLNRYRPGEAMEFVRNPYDWRRGGPDVAPRIVLRIVPDQDAELAALQTGDIDFTQSDVRASDVAALRARGVARQVRLHEVGTALDGDLLWFNLTRSKRSDRRAAWLQATEFRRAISQAVDRQAFVDTVHYGAATAAYTVVSPSNRAWFDEADDVRAPGFDIARSNHTLDALGLGDRDSAGVRRDRNGAAVQFTLLTQKGNTALERGAEFIRRALVAVGVHVEVVALEPNAVIAHVRSGDYDAAYFHLVTSDTDPSLNAEFWASSGGAHVWNAEQKMAESDWEREIDRLMTVVTASVDSGQRRRAFRDVQRIIAEQVPALCFAFPRMWIATSSRLAGAIPAPYRPPILWNPDRLTASAY